MQRDPSSASQNTGNAKSKAPAGDTPLVPVKKQLVVNTKEILAVVQLRGAADSSLTTEMHVQPSSRAEVPGGWVFDPATYNKYPGLTIMELDSSTKV